MTPSEPPLGRGYTADVYAWGDGRVLKLFHGSEGRERADREYRVTRAVHAAGLPAPAAYDMVEVRGRSGIVFERVNGPSLVDAVHARPWTLFAAVRELADLHARIHRLPCPDGLPTQREWLAAEIAATGLTCPALADLPDGDALCHGDFHPGNVLLGPAGPVVIDWGRATRGHALGDVAYTLRLLRMAELPPWVPRPMHLLLAGTRPMIHRLYLKRYFRRCPGTRREVEAWQGPFAAAGVCRGQITPPRTVAR